MGEFKLRGRHAHDQRFVAEGGLHVQVGVEAVVGDFDDLAADLIGAIAALLRQH
ncbi:hypothetical protein D3C73_1500120 [compost metagenome]